MIATLGDMLGVVVRGYDSDWGEMKLVFVLKSEYCNFVLA
jgi:hypothetical protein